MESSYTERSCSGGPNTTGLDGNSVMLHFSCRGAADKHYFVPGPPQIAAHTVIAENTVLSLSLGKLSNKKCVIQSKHSL